MWVNGHKSFKYYYHPELDKHICLFGEIHIGKQLSNARGAIPIDSLLPRIIEYDANSHVDIFMEVTPDRETEHERADGHEEKIGIWKTFCHLRERTYPNLRLHRCDYRFPDDPAAIGYVIKAVVEMTFYLTDNLIGRRKDMVDYREDIDLLIFITKGLRGYIAAVPGDTPSEILLNAFDTTANIRRQLNELNFSTQEAILGAVNESAYDEDLTRDTVLDLLDELIKILVSLDHMTFDEAKDYLVSSDVNAYVQIINLVNLVAVWQAPIFDMYTLARMIHVEMDGSYSKNCIVYAGDAHIHFEADVLERLNYELVYESYAEMGMDFVFIPSLFGVINL